MKQEILIQIIALILLAVLSLFFNPLSADFEGKIIFFGIIILIFLFFVIFDIYNEIKESKIKIKLFEDKLNIVERTKKLEEFQRK